MMKNAWTCGSTTISVPNYAKYDIYGPYINNIRAVELPNTKNQRLHPRALLLSTSSPWRKTTSWLGITRSCRGGNT